ncbi:ATP-binding protein [Streptomyces sp. NPDC057424]|uniref:ATP-binding protein n=1 Tax=Streptomyces sp. NPDC057424 TaxID=3346127 RepID=UPI0036AF5985
MPHLHRAAVPVQRPGQPRQHETSSGQSRYAHLLPLITARRPRGARLTRLLATEHLRSWGLPLGPAEQTVAELATNAATHGRVPGRDFRLTLYVVGGTLRIEVTDTRGDRLPHPTRPAPDATTGRGLPVVDTLSDRWGVTPGPHPRKTVWAEVDVPK